VNAGSAHTINQTLALILAPTLALILAPTLTLTLTLSLTLALTLASTLGPCTKHSSSREVYADRPVDKPNPSLSTPLCPNTTSSYTALHSPQRSLPLHSPTTPKRTFDVSCPSPRFRSVTTSRPYLRSTRFSLSSTCLMRRDSDRAGTRISW
jgi:hypothetical protein